MNKELKNKIYKLLPDLKEPSLLCEVRSDEYGMNGRIVSFSKLAKINEYRIAWDDCSVSTEKETNIKIIGKPIRLADVLRAIMKITDMSSMFWLHPGTNEIGFDFPKEVCDERIYWNLLKNNLDDQSEKTWDAIDKLID